MISENQFISKTINTMKPLKTAISSDVGLVPLLKKSANDDCDSLFGKRKSTIIL